MSEDARLSVVALVMAKGATNWRPWADDAQLVLDALDALTAARGQHAMDENALPMELIPEGWRLNLLRSFDDIHLAAAWACEIVTTTASKFLDAHGFGSTPRGAVLAAIEAMRHE